MEIPDFLIKDDYLQNPIMRRFLKEHKLNFVENKADYINTIKEFADQNEDNKKEVINWILKVVKEGSKEICYRRIHNIGSSLKEPRLVEEKIREAYPNCPMRNIFSYTNTHESTMIDYQIITDEANEVVKISFTFSRLFFRENIERTMDETVFPLFIEIYLDEGFIISRAKAKSTLYNRTQDSEDIDAFNKVNTMDYAMFFINQIISLFDFKVENNYKITKNEIYKMLYELYNQYSFTPKDVQDKIDSQRDLINEFVNHFFNCLNLDIRNKEKAILDAEIILEKYISINGDNELLFKKDRPAYLIKVSSDNENELTMIDATSNKNVPLQCTETFFDSKKCVIRSKACKRLNLIFKRHDDTYFKSNPLVVQFGIHKNHGYVKTMQYAEEADIQNVLQTIFRNY